MTYDITDVGFTAAGTVVTATISGNFPGSPSAGLRYRFEEYDDRNTRRLRIAP
ncbi:hypothetical protein ACQPYA_25160 [Micromonospora sp. CA-263727]|uniref:hypothetical protein n=1 Tax=Micromonospora sp. CA-263727 TaxID=3239967 RepID=UPI003D9404C0